MKAALPAARHPPPRHLPADLRRSRRPKRVAAHQPAATVAAMNMNAERRRLPLPVCGSA
jgi:hypothetical protein